MLMESRCTTVLEQPKKRKKKSCSAAPGVRLKDPGVESWLPCKLRPTWTCSPEWLGPRSSAPSRNTPPSDGPGRPGACPPPCDTHTLETKERRGGVTGERRGAERGLQCLDRRRQVEALRPAWRFSQTTTSGGAIHWRGISSDSRNKENFNQSVNFYLNSTFPQPNGP